MKNLVLASALGTLAGAFVVPAIGGPVHFAVTRPYSLFGYLPGNPNSLPASIVLGTAPLDFILTDVMFGGSTNQFFVTVNGNRVCNLGKIPSQGLMQDTHMTSGVFIPAGSTIGVEITNAQPDPQPVTLAGYVQ